MLVTNKSTCATEDEETSSIAGAGPSLQFCPVANEDIIAGTRVVTPYGVGVVQSIKDCFGKKVVVTMPWGTLYTPETKLDFNVLPALLRNADRMKETADSLLRDKKYKEAAATFEGAFRSIPRSQQDLAPHNMSLLCSTISFCYIRAENYDKALMWTEQSLKFNPKNYKAMFRQGVIHSRLGNYVEADSIFRKVSKQLQGSDADALRRESKANKERLEKKQQRVTDKRPFSHFFSPSPRGTSALDIEDGPQHKMKRTVDDEEDGSLFSQNYSGLSWCSMIFGLRWLPPVLTLGGVACIGLIVGFSFGKYKR
eukprot:GHVL01010608.1.p1 GENE.GHVL01010608.1~~GHVL01010608.1.p1  ORF type:complete len:311 (+),score=47.54 GHVL01010608.1:57-989(+)